MHANPAMREHNSTRTCERVQSTLTTERTLGLLHFPKTIFVSLHSLKSTAIRTLASSTSPTVSSVSHSTVASDLSTSWNCISRSNLKPAVVEGTES